MPSCHALYKNGRMCNLPIRLDSIPNIWEYSIAVLVCWSGHAIVMLGVDIPYHKSERLQNYRMLHGHSRNPTAGVPQPNCYILYHTAAGGTH